MAWKPYAWRNLAACVDDLIAPNLRGRLVMGHHRMARDGEWCGSYWFDLDGERIFHLPGPYADKGWGAGRIRYPAIYRWDDATMFERVIGTYLDTPRDELLEPIAKDAWGITDILRAADRRLGFMRLSFWALASLETGPARRVLAARFADRRQRHAA